MKPGDQLLKITPIGPGNRTAIETHSLAELIALAEGSSIYPQIVALVHQYVRPGVQRLQRHLCVGKRYLDRSLSADVRTMWTRSLVRFGQKTLSNSLPKK